MNKRHSVATSYLLPAVIVLLLITCTGPDPLPQPTQTGSNTFGCRINGKPYVPDGGRGFMPSKAVNGGFLVQYTPLGLGIHVYTYSKDRQRVALFLSEYSLGRHLLNRTTGTIPGQINPRNYGQYVSGEGEEYVTNARYTGWVELTRADTATGVVAGSFQFEAATSAGKTVTISDGRFDVNYRTQ